MLIPMLSTGQPMILDNATLHHLGRIRELIESAECELKYLPPCSPKLNQIEPQWFPIKNRVRKMVTGSESFPEKVARSLAASS